MKRGYIVTAVLSAVVTVATFVPQSCALRRTRLELLATQEYAEHLARTLRECETRLDSLQGPRPPVPEPTPTPHP